MAVFLCKWEETAHGWRLWVKGKPTLCGDGRTYVDAETALIDAIWNSSDNPDCIDPIIPEYDPPLPPNTKAKAYFRPELFIVRGDEPLDAFDQATPNQSRPDDNVIEHHSLNPSNLFTQGICKTCKHGRGERTAVSLTVDHPGSNVNGGFLSSASFSNSRNVYSNSFLSLLRPKELDALELQPVVVSSESSRCEYFELCGPAPVPFVGVQGLDAVGFECPDCGMRRFGVHEPNLLHDGLAIDAFVCRSNLPDPIPSCFTVGLPNEPRLCLTRHRLDQIRGSKYAKGIMSERLGVIDEDKCDPHPRLHNRLGPCDLCRQWIAPHDVHRQPQRGFEIPAKMCSRENFQWQEFAEERGLISVVRRTVSLSEIRELVESGQKPRNTEIISFRCSQCWRLGRIVLDNRWLHLDW